MQELYEDNGEVEIVTVNSYDEFVEKEPALKTFDVIFLDVNLGHETYSGLDAFSWLQKHEFKKRIVYQKYRNTQNDISKCDAFHGRRYHVD